MVTHAGTKSQTTDTSTAVEDLLKGVVEGARTRIQIGKAYFSCLLVRFRDNELVYIPASDIEAIKHSELVPHNVVVLGVFTVRDEGTQPVRIAERRVLYYKTGFSR